MHFSLILSTLFSLPPKPFPLNALHSVGCRHTISSSLAACLNGFPSATPCRATALRNGIVEWNRISIIRICSWKIWHICRTNKRTSERTPAFAQRVNDRPTQATLWFSANGNGCCIRFGVLRMEKDTHCKRTYYAHTYTQKHTSMHVAHTQRRKREWKRWVQATHIQMWKINRNKRWTLCRIERCKNKHESNKTMKTTT